MRDEIDKRVEEAVRNLAKSKPRPKRIGLQVIKVERVNESW